jgi:hypothetical protein
VSEFKRFINMKRFALLCALWLLAGNAEAQQALSYIQLSPTPNYLANGGPGFVQIDAGGHPFIAQAIPGSGTVTNAASLANNAMVVGDGGGAGIKTVGGSIGGSFTTAGALSFTGAASGTTFALPAGGPFTFTYPLASQTLASLAGVETFTNKTYSGGVFGGTFSGNFTLSGVPTLSGLSVGAQVACLGLSATNQMVLLGAGCGAGGGGSPGGSNGQIQYNNAGAFGGLPTGTGVATALGVNTGSAGAFGVTNLAQIWSAVQTINLNAAALPAAVGGTSFRIGGANATVNRLTMDAFGAVNSLLFQRAAGTAASPTALQSQDVMGSILAFGYGATGYSSGSRATIQLFADQNWTDTAQGAGITFSTTLNGGTTALERLRITNDGGITVHDVSGAAPTGGSKGPGSINVANGVYINNIAVGTSSVSLTAGTPGIVVSPSPITGTGTISLAGRTAVADANCGTLTASGTSLVAFTTVLTAARSCTLPAASAMQAGQRLCFVDEGDGTSPAINGTNTVTINRAGSDKIAGATSLVLSVGYAATCLEADGSAKWGVLANMNLAAQAAISNNFLTGIGADGVFTRAQPAFSNLSGAATAAQIGGSAASHGVPVDVAGTVTWKVVPDCQTSGGTQALNYTQSTDAWSCNAVSGGAGITCSGSFTAVNGDCIQKVTASGGATANLDLDLTSATYTLYELKCSGIIPLTNAQRIQVQFGTGSGPIAANYVWSAHYSNGATAGDENETSTSVASGIQITATAANSAPGVAFSADLFNPQSTTENKVLTFRGTVKFSGGGQFAEVGYGGYNGSTAAVTHIYVSAVSGNLTDGGFCSLIGRGN